MHWDSNHSILKTEFGTVTAHGWKHVKKFEVQALVSTMIGSSSTTSSKSGPSSSWPVWVSNPSSANSLCECMTASVLECMCKSKSTPAQPKVHGPRDQHHHPAREFCSWVSEGCAHFTHKHKTHEHTHTHTRSQTLGYIHTHMHNLWSSPCYGSPKRAWKWSTIFFNTLISPLLWQMEQNIMLCHFVNLFFAKK